MKLKITFVGYITVDVLEHYQATTIHEAAANEDNWIRNGDHELGEVIAGCEDISFQIEGIES